MDVAVLADTTLSGILIIFRVELHSENGSTEIPLAITSTGKQLSTSLCKNSLVASEIAIVHHNVYK